MYICLLISFLCVQIKYAVQQTGFIREKRGFKQIRGVPIHSEKQDDVQAHKNNARPSNLPNDPLYPKEWYIVSINTWEFRYCHYSILLPHHCHYGIVLPHHCYYDIVLSCHCHYGMVLPYYCHYGIVLPHHCHYGILLPHHCHYGIVLPHHCYYGIVLSCHCHYSIVLPKHCHYG